MSRENRSRGSILLPLLFMVLLFFIGFGLLFFAGAHSRVIRAMTFKWKATGHMRQDLVYYLHGFRESVFSRDIRNVQSPETEYFTAGYFPMEVIAERHTITPSFDYYHLPPTDVPEVDYTRTRLTASFDVACAQTHRQGGHPFGLNAGVIIDVLAGDVPLMFIPVLVQLPEPVHHPGSDFFQEKGVVNMSGTNVVAEDVETLLDFPEVVGGAFKIPAGDVLFWRDIRPKLGLEPLDLPVEEGVYLVVESLYVRTVFIQGNVDGIIFFVLPGGLEPVQGIRIIKNAVTYDIRYTPGQGDFLCWDPLLGQDKFFLENIIVNGSVNALEQEGDAAFTPRTNLKLLVAGKTVIRSDLVTGTGRMTTGKVMVTNLVLAGGMGNLIGGGEGEEPPVPGVVVETQEETEVGATIIVDGTFENKSKKLKLKGSLYCKDLQNSGVMEVSHRESSSAAAMAFKVLDFRYIYRFFISFIEEVYGD
jgi:hypothetical protein